jgi:hypothetical protein
VHAAKVGARAKARGAHAATPSLAHSAEPREADV